MHATTTGFCVSAGIPVRYATSLWHIASGRSFELDARHVVEQARRADGSRAEGRPCEAACSKDTVRMRADATSVVAFNVIGRIGAVAPTVTDGLCMHQCRSVTDHRPCRMSIKSIVANRRHAEKESDGTECCKK